MKFATSTALLALAASGAEAHYYFPSLIVGSVVTPAWQYVRQWTGYYTNNPVTSVTSLNIRCNVDGSTNFAPGIQSVAAGSVVGMTANPNIYHAGVAVAYLAKVPAGQTAATFDGSGSVWFKIAEIGPTFAPGVVNWPLPDATNITVTIPKATPPGDYLIRIEQIALHVAQSAGAAQFYLSCGQITVTGSGAGTPGPLVAFPGAYSATDPGILINIYNPVPTSYTFPGPAVWQG